MRSYIQTAATLILAVLTFPAQAEAQDASPPTAKTIPFAESLYGQTVSDPYRWMEDQGPDYQAWLKAQGAYARAFLDKLPGRVALLQTMAAHARAQASLGQIQAKGGRLFLPRRPAAANYTQLFVRDGVSAPERLLLDPTTLDTANAKGTAIDYWEASPDGKYVYFGASSGGSELSTLRVIDVESGKILPGGVPLALFNYSNEVPGGIYPQWLPDGSGFFYTRLAEGAKPGTQEMFLNGRLFLHRLSASFDRDVLIIKPGHDTAVPLDPIESASIVTEPGSEQAVMMVANGVARAKRLYVAPLAAAMTGKAHWTAVAAPGDKVEGFALSGDRLYLLVRDRSRGRIVETSAINPSIASAGEILPEGDSVISAVLAAKDGIYVVSRGTRGAEARFVAAGGEIKRALLPFAGMSYAQFATPAADGLYMELENAVTPRRMLRLAGGSVVDTRLAPPAAYPTDDYVTEAVEVAARDGAKVPLEIFYKKGTPRDGRQPVVLDAYGAYGANNDVPFLPVFTAFLDQGFIIAIAHVRGGGELGDDWWHAGQQKTKPNTWRDAIDCAEYLIAQGWARKGGISLHGASAGGIMAGRAVTERPDLWASVTANVGAMNVSRFEFTPNGVGNTPEFGSVKTPEGFRALMAMDAYHHLKEGVAYPPMLLTAGLNDPRVIAWQPAKFVARAQAATSDGPVLFMVNTDQGHGVGSSQMQLANEFADMGAFSLWATKRNARKDQGEQSPTR